MAGALHGVLASLKAAAAAVTDAFFEYVSLLLNTTSTNGAQNNTFLDGSTNNFSVTRNGNTTQGTFSPFSQTGWSNYFDGTGDWLTLGGQTELAFGSGDFTVELWIYSNASGPRILYDSRPTGTSGAYPAIYINSSNQLEYIANSASRITGATTIALGQWHHVALSRSGTSTRLFLNGAQEGSTYSDSTTYLNGASRPIIGANGVNTANDNYNGYVSNLRALKGTAQYTATFTPPTSPLTAITNTSLLTCQSNRFIDNSSNNFTITRNGDTSVQAFSPFNPTAAWSASTNGGSGYFDGTGDYLSIADSATIRFGTGVFTIQGWVYRNAAGATHTIAAKGGASTGWVLQITSTNVLRFTDTTTNIDTTTTIPASTWTHVAVVRTGTGANGLKLYINAVDSATGTSSTDFNQTDALNIGADRSNANAFNGYIASLKYTAGTAESISVPTAPATGGTVLLNFTNAGIYDSASSNDLETVGNAQVSTVQAKWGTTSMAFDGTGDWLVIPSRPALRLGAANFTIEYWVYPTNLTGTIQHLNTEGPSATTNYSFAIITSGTNLLYYLSSTGTTWNIANGVSIGTATLNTWQHVALVRNGNTFTPYLNGVAGTTTTSSAALFDFASALAVGNAVVSSPVGLIGYIDDLRITNGIARYTSNFTAPTAAFPLQ